MGNITSANATAALTVPGVFSAPQLLQGFDVDGVIDNDAVDVAESKVGVDGILSAGFVFALVPTTIHIQADSASIVLFETWLQTQKANLQTYLATLILTLPAVGRQYTLTNGVLKRPKQMPDVHRVLQARTFGIDWQDISPANI